MKLKILFIILIIIFAGWNNINSGWISEKHIGYTIFFTPYDHENINEYVTYFENGEKAVTDFFQTSFKNKFDIYIHPNRESLDSTWQTDWNYPEFNSECWMVASGVANKLDILSPRLWDSLSCEHSYSNKLEVQQLITHELVHVFHGQLNISNDFSNVSGIDWFIEGLAVYVSGQCDSVRINAVKNAVINNQIPKDINSFWSGNLKYGLSGAVVMYVDIKFGRKKLIELLKYNNLNELLNSLGTTESEIIDGFVNYISII